MTCSNLKHILHLSHLGQSLDLSTSHVTLNFALSNILRQVLTYVAVLIISKFLIYEDC